MNTIVTRFQIAFSASSLFSQMEEEYSVVDTSKLLQATSDFSFDPGTRSEAAVKEFLASFPLPVIISALQTRGDVPGLEDALIDCLEKIFRTKYGASLIPHFMPFIVVGLQANSQRVRTLSCKTISSLLENLEDNTGLATSLIKENDVYPVLLNCLIDGDEQVAVAATDAIRNLAGSQQGIVSSTFERGAKIPSRDISTKCSPKSLRWNCKESRIMARNCLNEGICHTCGKTGHCKKLLQGWWPRVIRYTHDPRNLMRIGHVVWLIASLG